MKFDKKYVLAGFLLILFAVGYSFFIKKKPRPTQYAKRFCYCSEDFADIKALEIAKKAEPSAYAAAKEKHTECLGLDDPFKELSPEERLAFEREFLQQLHQQCPDVARKMGFVIK